MKASRFESGENTGDLSAESPDVNCCAGAPLRESQISELSRSSGLATGWTTKATQAPSFEIAGEDGYFRSESSAAVSRWELVIVGGTPGNVKQRNRGIVAGRLCGSFRPKSAR